MSRENSPYVIGDYWLDHRRDGRSPGIWQIASYSIKSRSTVYRSTKQRALGDAIAWFQSWEAEQRSKAKNQPREAAQLLPHLFNYLREQGPDIKRTDTIKSSFRAWIGFLMQDELGTGATIADIDKNFVTRFRRWRMGEHSWEVEWDDKVLKHSSKGVCGKTVQRNIEDLRSALHHAEGNNRFEAPKVNSVPKKLIKDNPRQVFDMDTLGAILGYAKPDKGLYRELCLMVASGSRPGHAMRFDPSSPIQWGGDFIDLQPWREDETDKRGAVLPVVAPLKPILADWKENPHDPVQSRKRTWRTMRRVLGLPAWAEAYCIRTTVATHLDAKGTPGAQISGILGHVKESRGTSRTTTKHYLLYDPTTCDRAKEVLTEFFEDVMQCSEKWAADHLRTTPLRGRPISLVPNDGKVYEIRQGTNGGR